MEESKLLKGRVALFFMQIFSTMGFGILLSSMVLYVTGGLDLNAHFATALTAGFIAFNFSLHVLGGFVGGRFLSYRGLFVIGMLLQALGSIFISIPHISMLLFGLALFLSGCGLNVICINCMLTQLFDPHDKRRESAFLWNYSGMNIGFLVGFTVSGIFQLFKGFHWLFLISSLGSIIAFGLALFYWDLLKDHDTIFSKSKNHKQRALIAFSIIGGLIVALTFLLAHPHFSNALILAIGLIVAFLFAYFAWRQPEKTQGNRVWAYLILTVSSLIFWTLYQMAPMGLTLFFERNVSREYFGIAIPPQWMQNINTCIIIIGGPLMAHINQRLRKKGYSISIPFQFTTALILIGVGFLLLPVGIHFANAKGFSSIWWVISCYLFQSIGELFISPIGYAMVGQLIPAKLQALAMGAWLMVAGVAATLSNYFSQLALGAKDVKNPLETNSSYSSTFLQLGIYAIAVGVILYFLRPFLHKLIQEKRNLKSDEPAPYNAPQD